MAIQVFITAVEFTGEWEFEVQYFNRQGNMQEDIWETEVGYIKNTSLYQLYLKATYESLMFLNTLALKLKPDTREVLIHIPCDQCIRWLQEEEKRMLTTKDRAKVERGYRQFIKAIKVESSNWKVQHTTETKK